jgi:mRNA interferase RelE/StbE
MGSYKLNIRPSVRRDISDVPKPVLKRIMSAIRALENDPLPRGTTKLKGSQDTFRVRVGEYRIIFEVDFSERIVSIIHVANRRDVYRKY